MIMMMMMMCISRSEVCSRFLAVWWCPKRIQKYRIPKYGSSEEAQAQKRNIIIIGIQQLGRSELFFLFLFFYFSIFYFSFYFSIVKNLARDVDRYQFASHIKETHCMRLQ